MCSSPKDFDVPSQRIVSFKATNRYLPDNIITANLNFWKIKRETSITVNYGIPTTEAIVLY